MPLYKENRQLCKLLNIRPKYRISYNDTSNFSNVEYYENKREALIKLSNSPNPWGEYSKQCEEIYPDLSEPSNFLKILELQAKYSKVPVYFQSVGQVLDDMYSYAIAEEQLGYYASMIEFKYT